MVGGRNQSCYPAISDSPLRRFFRSPNFMLVPCSGASLPIAPLPSPLFRPVFSGLTGFPLQKLQLRLEVSIALPQNGSEKTSHRLSAPFPRHLSPAPRSPGVVHHAVAHGPHEAQRTAQPQLQQPQAVLSEKNGHRGGLGVVYSVVKSAPLLKVY